MRRMAFGLLASSLLTLFTGAQASGLGVHMERALTAPAPEKATRTRRDPGAMSAAESKNVLMDGAALAVLERGASGGFRNHFSASTKHGDNDIAADAPVLRRVAENTAGQAGPILRETINALQLPDTRITNRGDFAAATCFLRDHAAEQLRTALAPIALHCLATMNPQPAISCPMALRAGMSRRGLADHIAHTTVDGLLDTMARHEQWVRHAATAGNNAYFT